MWNPTTGKRLAQPLLADSAPITSVAFDPLGRRFAVTGYGDGTVKVWFTASLQQEGPRLAADPGATAAAAFEAAGNTLLVVDDRGGAFAWPASPAAWEQRACSVAGRNLTRADGGSSWPGRRTRASVPEPAEQPRRCRRPLHAIRGAVSGVAPLVSASSKIWRVVWPIRRTRRGRRRRC